MAGGATINGIAGIDVKTPAAPAPGIIGAQPAPATTPSPVTSGGIMAQPKIGVEVFGPDGYKFSSASAATRTVDQKTGTVSGQLDSILAADGVHMQRARANALALAADMGLGNSSIAVGNAHGALIDRATPIATSDANIYDGAARDNQNAQNAVNIANANNYNQLGGIMVQQMGEDKRLSSQQQFTATENRASREHQERVQMLQEQGMDKRQAEQIAAQEKANREQQQFSAAENKANREQQERIQQLQEQGMEKRQAEQIAAQERQAKADREAAEQRAKDSHDNALKQLGYQNELANKNIPSQRQAELATITTDRINQILADGNLSPEAKQGAIKNVVDNSNATAAMYEKMYGVTLPKFQMPGSTPAQPPAQTPAPGAAAGATAPGASATPPLAQWGGGGWHHDDWRKDAP